MSMIHHWAANIADRRTIEEFFDWLIANVQNEETPERIRLFDINIEKKLDEFHGIDRRQLEHERQQMLAEIEHPHANEKAVDVRPYTPDDEIP